MSLPDYEIAIDWAGDGSFTAVGDDVSARVFDRGTLVTAQYGREQGRSFDPLAGGRGQFELDNRSRDYSPENSESPLAGKLRPGRELRIRATYSGATHGLLRGFIDDFDIQPALEQRSVQVTGLDGLARLRYVRLSTPLYQGLRTGAAIGVLLDAAGWPADRRDLDVGGSTLPWWWVDGQDAFAALQEILDSEGPGCRATVDIDGTFVFRDRHHRLLRPASTTVQATFRSGGAEPCYSAPMSYNPGWRDVVNDVTYSVPVRAPSGQMESVWQMSGQRSLADGETVALSARSSEPFFGAVPPEPDVDFTPVSGTVTTSLSRTSGQAVTVLVTAVSGPAVIDGMAVRAYPVATQSTVEVHAEDAASIDEFGRQSWPSGREPSLASLPDAIAIADIILAGRARRQPTVTVTFRGGLPARLTQQLSRDLSDRVRVVDSGTGLNADCWLERIEHAIGRGDHVTTFALEKIPTPAMNPFTFNTSGQGFNQGAFGDTGRDDAATVFIFDHPTQGRFDVGLLGN